MTLIFGPDAVDRKLNDIFSVESEVAKAIAEQLRAKLTSGRASHRPAHSRASFRSVGLASMTCSS